MSQWRYSSKQSIIPKWSVLWYQSGVLQHLTTLCELQIENCYSMKWKELENLNSKCWRSIKSQNWNICLKGFSTLPLYRLLRIMNCANLTSIPEWVTSLQVLDIKDCSKVTSLHEGWKTNRFDVGFIMLSAVDNSIVCISVFTAELLF
jgi:hypothetical protein